MIRILLGALLVRRSQALLVTLLALLAGAAAAAAPPYLLATAQSVAVDDVAHANPIDRVVALRKDVAPDGVETAIDQAQQTALRRLPATALRTVRGLALSGQLASGGKQNASLAARDGVCQRVRLRGRCPAADREAMVSVGMAQAAGLGVGDAFGYRAAGVDGEIEFQVVGIYLPADPADPYWARSGQPLADAAASNASIFVTGDTIVRLEPETVTAVLDLIVAEDVFRNRDATAFADAVEVATVEVGRLGFTVTATIGRVAGQVRDDQQLIYIGVSIIAGQLLLMCWFALFLAVRYTGDERRGDLGLLKLRGTGGIRSWLIMGGQSALPVVAGGAIGAVPGYLLAGWLAGGVRGTALHRQALQLAAVAAACAVVGALIAALVAEWRALRAPVVDLMRKVPQRRYGWRTRTVDLVAIALAAAGVYQATVAGDDSRGLVLLVPGLLAMALGLLAGRLVTLVATGAAGSALHAGRPAGVLTAAYLARSRGTMRVGVLLTVAVTLLVYAATGWDVARSARIGRAIQEQGAERVYTVQAVTRQDLLNAVRAADPSGRWAMAVAVTAARFNSPPVLAVDTTRLASVASWRDEYPDAGELARRLRPAAFAPVAVRGAELRLDATYAGSGVAVRLFADLVGPHGQRLTGDFGTLGSGRGRYRASVPACADPPGCRLTGFSATQTVVPLPPSAKPSAPLGPDGLPGPAITVEIHSVSQDATPEYVLSGEQILDRTRWRPSAGSTGLVALATVDGLLLHLATGLKSATVVPVDAPLPVPAAVVGAMSREFVMGKTETAIFGTAKVPVNVVATASALPRVGDAGLLMVDLEYADRVVDDLGGADTMQVWLARGAPHGILDRLKEAGVEVVASSSVGTGTARFEAQGPALVMRFQLLAVLVGLLLACGVLAVVTAVERPGRSAELSALRVQGAGERLVRAVSLRGYALLVAVFGVLGVATAVLAGPVTGKFPVFLDDWAILPTPPVRLGAFAVASVLALALPGVVAAVGARRLRRSARRGWGRPE